MIMIVNILNATNALPEDFRLGGGGGIDTIDLGGGGIVGSISLLLHSLFMNSVCETSTI
jgi:hypothetical protein